MIEVILFVLGFLVGGVFIRVSYSEEVESGKIFYIHDMAYKGQRVPELDGKE